MYQCENCRGLHGGYALLTVQSRGKAHRFSFCSIDCLLEWARAIARLPDTGLELGPRRR